MKRYQLCNTLSGRLAILLTAAAIACSPAAAFAEAPSGPSDTSLRGALETALSQSEGAATDADGSAATAGDAIPEPPAEVLGATADPQALPETVEREVSSYTDSAGNLFVVSDDVPGVANLADAKVEKGRDLVLLGGGEAVRDASVGGDVIAAARSLDLRDSEVAGSVRAVAEAVQINGTSVEGNVTVLAGTVEVSQDSEAGGVYVGAQHATFSGAAESLDIVAGTAALNGKVKGDVAIYANEVVIGEDVDVAGELTVYSPQEPQIPDGASVGSYRYIHSENTTINVRNRLDGVFDGTFVETIEDRVPDSMRVYVGVGLVSVIVCLICAVLLAIFLRGPVESAGAIARKRFAFLIVSGLLGAFLVVPVIVLLTLLLATIPLAIGLGLLMGIVTAISVPFTAASLGKALLPKWHRVGSAVLFSLIIGVLLVVPYAGLVVGVFCFVYMFGYLVQSMYLGMRGRGVSGAAALPAHFGDAGSVPSARVPDFVD